MQWIMIIHGYVMYKLYKSKYPRLAMWLPTHSVFLLHGYGNSVRWFPKIKWWCSRLQPEL
jgi:hypothetical protein